MDQIQRRLTGSARKSANHDRPLESVGVTGRVNERLVGCGLGTYRFTWPPLAIRMRVHVASPSDPHEGKFSHWGLRGTMASCLHGSH